MSDSQTGPLPFEDMLVLDLSSGIAGGYAGKLLVDAGAELIKLEGPAGDPLRRATACARALEPGEDSALFRYLHASKRSVVGDLASEAGRDLALDLAARADVVLESFGPGGLARHGLDFATLRARNPSLSLVSISHWGLDGPFAERPANEFTLQASSGATAYRGMPGRPPVAAGGALGDFAAGTYAGVAAALAWLAARRSGGGQHVDVSAFESIVSALTTFHDLRSQWIGGFPLPQAFEAPSIEPARDGWVGFSAYTGQQWQDFCRLIERPDLAEDERFLQASERMKNRALIEDAVQGWTRRHDVAEMIETASLLRIPSAPVLDGATLLECDHFAERGVFVESPHGFRQPRPPYRLGRGALRPAGLAPALGADTEALRAELAGPAPARREPGSDGADRPLEGLRVLDLTAFWAGPVLTSLLGDMGADVIKLESIQRPDGMRFVSSTGKDPSWEWSEVFHGANPSKRGLTLDLDSAEGRELMLRLAEGADVVVENYSARVLEHFDLAWDALSARNPRIILVRMPAWGLDGPWRDRTGFAPNLEQASGLAWVTGYADTPMVVRGACDPLGGMHAGIALLAALEVRRKTGVGQLVEVPLIEPALNVAGQQVVEWTAYGELMERSENRGQFAAPQGVYRCAPPAADREAEFVAVAVAEDAQWRALCALLGEVAWAEDPELARESGRRAAHDAIDARLGAWCAARGANAAEAALVAAGVPAAAVVNAHHLSPNPQLEHRGFFQRLRHPVTGESGYPSPPMRFSRWGAGLHTSPPPTLGQHNDELLGGELGLDDDALGALRAAGVIGQEPPWL